MDRRDCNECGETRALVEYAKDSRNKSGRRGTCKICDRKATARRRAGMTPKPGALALVLAPNFPAPPQDPPPQEADASTSSAPARQPGGAGDSTTYADAAEVFIAALVPPADDADALLVRSLRGLADLADQATYRVMPDEKLTALVASMVRVQRELAATRAARAKAQPAEAKPAARSAANY